MKSLLGVVSPSSIDPQNPLVTSLERRASFWNFARADYKSAYVNNTPTLLDTEDYQMWQSCGLQISSTGSLYADPAALKAIYGHGANVQKSETFYHAFRARPEAVSTLLATERAQHARKRRIMGQAFSEGAMRGMERYVLENVEVWERGVEEKVEAARREGRAWSERVDMGRWNNYLVFGE